MTSQSSHDGQPPELTLVEAARRLGVPYSTAHRHAAKFGRKVLGRWRIDPAAVEQALTGEQAVA